MGCYEWLQTEVQADRADFDGGGSGIHRGGYGEVDVAV